MPAGRSEQQSLETSGGVLSLAYYPDGSLLAAGNQLGNEEDGFKGSVDFWYVPNWEPWRVINDYTRAVTSIDFSEDGMLFMAAFTNPDETDNSVSIWDTSTWDITQTLRTGSVLEIALSPDGKLVATTPDRYAVNIWQTKTGFVRRTIFTAFTNAISQITFSPDGRSIAAGGYDGVVRIWDVETGTLLRAMNTGSVIQSLAYSPDGTLLASGGGYQNTEIHLWDTASGALLRMLEGHPSCCRQPGILSRWPAPGFWVIRWHAAPVGLAALMRAQRSSVLCISVIILLATACRASPQPTAPAMEFVQPTSTETIRTATPKEPLLTKPPSSVPTATQTQAVVSPTSALPPTLTAPAILTPSTISGLEQVGLIEYSPWDLVLAVAWSPAGDLIAVAAGELIYLYTNDLVQQGRLEAGDWTTSLAFHPQGIMACFRRARWSDAHLGC